MFANCFIFFNYEKSMKINYISQNEKWRKKKINYCSVFSEKKFCMVVLNLAKSISRLLLEKKKNGHQKRKKGQMCISSKQSDFCISSIIVNYFKNKNNGSCNYIWSSQRQAYLYVLVDSCDVWSNRYLLPRESLTDTVLQRKLLH